MRLVLDTNVWLDWLVFGDAAVAPIKAAVAQKRAEVYIDSACEAELERALGYDFGGKFTLDEKAQGACLAECRRVAKRIESEPAEAERIESGPAEAEAERIESGPAEAKRIESEPAEAERIETVLSEAECAGLPRCRDKDDQKFLEAALAARADVLVTKDRALLDLARRTARFRIVTPEEFTAIRGDLSSRGR